MGVLYIEGVAIRGGPEPCVGVCEGVGEASVGVVWAGLLSREIRSSGCRRHTDGRKAIPAAALARVVVGPCAVGEPGHARKLHAREPGGPVVARGWSMVPRRGWMAGGRSAA